MKRLDGIGLSEVQAVYGGPEGELWELLMGHQIHIGGFRSSMALAEKAGIQSGMKGVDLCCCNGAGMRFLVRFHGVSSMTGVDATPAVIERGRRRCIEEGMADRVSFVHADVCSSGLPAASADFVWGEDAWCYVVDKERLIAEAARIVKPSGTIAFTDWVEGPRKMNAEEARRFLAFMKFATLQDLDGYRSALARSGCEVLVAEDTGLFASSIDLYINMVDRQLTYDALRIVGFDQGVLESLAGEMNFALELAQAGKVIQGRFVAKKSQRDPALS